MKTILDRFSNPIHRERVISPAVKRRRVSKETPWPAPVLLLLGMMFFSPASADAGKRFALVIGANNYTHAPVLQNAVSDSRLVAATLKGIGFEVVALENSGVDSFYEGLENLKRLSAHAEVGLVYFAGHGIEVDGKNYLLPVDAELEAPGQLRSQTVALETVLRDMEEARIDAKVVILDCCRDNPIGRSWMKTRSIGRGLGLGEVTDTDLPEASLILYSAGPGEVALDGTGKNSPFTEALSKRLQEPGQHILEAFYKVSDDVVEVTGARQEPWVKSDGAGRTFRTLVLVPESAGGSNSPAAPATVSSATTGMPSAPVNTPVLETAALGTQAMAGNTSVSPGASKADTDATVPASTLTPGSQTSTTLPPATASVGATAPLPPSDATVETMKSVNKTEPANEEASKVGSSTVAPATAAIQLELPPSGYFSNSEVFKGSPYESFNDYTRRKILREAQEKLAGSGTPDGSMGKNTQSAIQKYQQSKSLPLTGLLDLATLESLALTGRTEENPPASQPRSRPSTHYSSTRSSGDNYKTGNTPRPQETVRRTDSTTKPKPVPGEAFIKSHAFKRITTGH